MEKPKVLFVSQEITPYLKESPIGKISRYLPQGIQERNKEIRTFMPRYGCINERRNQLHEVIRLSGMNLIIDDTDHPLIIKVASIQAARMQIYFIDNEDYFHRKHVLTDARGRYFKDNDERSIFFTRGVIETVKKLGWSPDLIHCNGWMTGLTPLYIKRVCQENPLFAETKIVYSIYDDEFPDTLDDNMAKKLAFDGISAKDLKYYKTPDFVNLTKAAIDLSDGIIIGSEKINAKVASYLKKSGKPVLDYMSTKTDEYIDAYSDFFDNILVNDSVLVE